LFCRLAGQVNEPSSAAVDPADRPAILGAGALKNKALGLTVTLGSAARAVSANSHATFVAGEIFAMTIGRHERVGNQNFTPGSA